MLRLGRRGCSPRGTRRVLGLGWSTCVLRKREDLRLAAEAATKPPTAPGGPGAKRIKLSTVADQANDSEVGEPLPLTGFVVSIIGRRRYRRLHHLASAASPRAGLPGV